jgi:hypothetical protein
MFHLNKLKGSFHIFKKYRDEGFNCSNDIAKEIVEGMDVELVFPRNRQGKRKKHFDEQNDHNKEESLSFIVIRSYFLVMIDMAIASFIGQFE